MPSLLHSPRRRWWRRRERYLPFQSLANGPPLAPGVAGGDVTYVSEPTTQLCSRISEG